STGRRTRTAAAAEDPGQASARGGEHGAAEEHAASGGVASNDPVPAPANGQYRDGAAPQSSARRSRRALKNWRVRSRLLLLVIIPILAAVALGGIRIASSVQSAFAYQRVVRLANLNGKIIGLVQALQSERQDTITFITLDTNGGRAAALSPRSPPAPEVPLGMTVLSPGAYLASLRA